METLNSVGVYVIAFCVVITIVAVIIHLYRDCKRSDAKRRRKEKATYESIRNPRDRYWGPPFQIWRTVDLLDMERKDLVQHLSQDSRVIHWRAEATVLSSQFPAWENGKVSLVRTTPYDLGYTGGVEDESGSLLGGPKLKYYVAVPGFVPMREVLARAKEFGLKPCHPAVVLFLRLQLDTEDEVDVVMDPVSSNDKRPFRCTLHRKIVRKDVFPHPVEVGEEYYLGEFKPVDEGSKVEVFTQLIFVASNE